MFNLLKIGALSLLATQVIASPAMEAAGACNTKNACYSAVRLHTPIESCKYLARKTVLPCPFTETITATNTAKPIITTKTVGTTRTTVTVTITALVPTVGAQQRAAAQEDAEGVKQQEANVPAPAVTDAAQLLEKRDIDAAADTSRCTAARTFGVSVVPADLHACTNISAYSAACDCFKVPHVTITKPATTTTSTTTTTVGGGTVTETVQATLTATKTITVPSVPIPASAT